MLCKGLPQKGFLTHHSAIATFGSSLTSFQSSNLGVPAHGPSPVNVRASPLGVCHRLDTNSKITTYPAEICVLWNFWYLLTLSFQALSGGKQPQSREEQIRPQRADLG